MGKMLDQQSLKFDRKNMATATGAERVVGHYVDSSLGVCPLVTTRLPGHYQLR
jgi:hypothetical protein